MIYIDFSAFLKNYCNGCVHFVPKLSILGNVGLIRCYLPKPSWSEVHHIPTYEAFCGLGKLWWKFSNFVQLVSFCGCSHSVWLCFGSRWIIQFFLCSFFLEFCGFWIWMFWLSLFYKNNASKILRILW